MVYSKAQGYTMKNGKGEERKEKKSCSLDKHYSFCTQQGRDPRKKTTQNDRTMCDQEYIIMHMSRQFSYCTKLPKPYL